MRIVSVASLAKLLLIAIVVVLGAIGGVTVHDFHLVVLNVKI